MTAARLAAALGAPLRMLHRLGRPAAVAGLSAGELDGYAAAIAAMLQARGWTLTHASPSWPQVHRAWAAAIGDVALRDRLAGRLHADDRLALIADGPAAFARRDALLAGACRQIDLATYYLQADGTGHDAVHALAAAVRRGVRVRLLVDDTMSWRKSREVPGTAVLLEQAQAAGIELRRWRDPRRPHDSNHRKMLIVDGRVAVVGGRNIADHYRGRDWRDLDLLLEGPTVATLSGLFDALWSGSARGEPGPYSEPPWVDTVPSGILQDPVPRFLLAAVGAATQRVELELAYLVAQPPICEVLAAAARRGVAVRVLTNSAASNDLPFATWTTADALRRLQPAGVQLRLRRGSGRTLHPKYLVVDGRWVSFGSHNLDYYSSRFCCETNLIVDDTRLADALTACFDQGWAEAEAPGADELQRWHAGATLSRWFDRVFRDFQ